MRKRRCYRYCAKLPSDVFTRLAPRYNVIAVIKNGTTYYQGSLTLPINSPVKEEIRVSCLWFIFLRF